MSCLICMILCHDSFAYNTSVATNSTQTKPLDSFLSPTPLAPEDNPSSGSLEFSSQALVTQSGSAGFLCSSCTPNKCTSHWSAFIYKVELTQLYSCLRLLLLISLSFYSFLTCVLHAQDSPLLLWMARMLVPFSCLCPLCGLCSSTHHPLSPDSMCTVGKVHICLHPNDNTLVEKIPCLNFLFYAKLFKTRERKK